MRTTRVWRRLLGIEHTVIESVELEPDGKGGEPRVRPKAGVASRFSRCNRRSPGYDSSGAPRRRRGLDWGATQVFLQATTCRVVCREHGVAILLRVAWRSVSVIVARVVAQRAGGLDRLAGLRRDRDR